MKTKILLICIAMLMPIATYAWIPFVEQGKVWSYNMEAGKTFSDFKGGNFLFELKIDGTAQISGKEYAKCFAYLDGEIYPDNNTPIFYLREDSRTSAVYAICNEKFPYDDKYPWRIFPSWMPIETDYEIAVFSALNPLASDTWMDYKYYNDFESFEMERCLSESSTGRQINGWKCLSYMHDDYNDYTRADTLYEGIGYVGESGTIYSPVGRFAPTDSSWLSFMLFQVTRPDGEILYLDEDNKPTVSVAEITGDENPAAEYYNLQGMPATKDAKGVVIVKQGAQSHKTLNIDR